SHISFQDLRIHYNRHTKLMTLTYPPQTFTTNLTHSIKNTPPTTFSLSITPSTPPPKNLQQLQFPTFHYTQS
ncbi:hypothetical protein, partial [Staphylococcus epidermidis]